MAANSISPAGGGFSGKGGKNKGGKGGKSKGKGEQMMKDTIDFLSALPETERQEMEKAENFTFTFQRPAEPLGEAMPQRVRSALLEPGASCRTLTLGADAVEAAAALCDVGWDPAVMNFAHGYNCGGGFEHAGGSQEESIFRSTSIFLSLWPHRRSDDGPGVLARGMWIGEYDEQLARKEPFYPHTDCGGIYSGHVRILRHMTMPGKPLCKAAQVESMPTIGVLTVAAQDCQRERLFRRELLVQKVRTALCMAAAAGHNALVLGAFGCGYFRNPPDVVAEVFSELLSLDGEFGGSFCLAVFAIPDARARPDGCNPRAFARYFPISDELPRPPSNNQNGLLQTRKNSKQTCVAKENLQHPNDEHSSTRHRWRSNK